MRITTWSKQVSILIGDDGLATCQVLMLTTTLGSIVFGLVRFVLTRTSSRNPYKLVKIYFHQKLTKCQIYVCKLYWFLGKTCLQLTSVNLVKLRWMKYSSKKLSCHAEFLPRRQVAATVSALWKLAPAASTRRRRQHLFSSFAFLWITEL